MTPSEPSLKGSENRSASTVDAGPQGPERGTAITRCARCLHHDPDLRTTRNGARICARCWTELEALAKQGRARSPSASLEADPHEAARFLDVLGTPKRVAELAAFVRLLASIDGGLRRQADELECIAAELRAYVRASKGEG